MRRNADDKSRGRLIPRPRSLQPPPGTPPPGSVPRYGEMPDAAKEAMDRSSADFTAGRLSELAQHARQAATARPPADQDAGQPGEPVADLAAAVAADPLAAGDSPAAADQVTAQWAWLAIAAMAVPLLVFLLVALV